MPFQFFEISFDSDDILTDEKIILQNVVSCSYDYQFFNLLVLKRIYKVYSQEKYKDKNLRVFDFYRFLINQITWYDDYFKNIYERNNYIIKVIEICDKFGIFIYDFEIFFNKYEMYSLLQYLHICDQVEDKIERYLCP